MKDIAASKSISRLPYSIGYFAVHLCRSWTTQAPLMHKENRNTGVKQVCKGAPQHPHARNGETEPENGLASLLHFPLYLAACCWTVSDSVQLGESRLRPGTLPLWGSSRGSLQGIRGDPVYQPSSRVREESRRAMPLSPVTSSKCTVRANARLLLGIHMQVVSGVLKSTRHNCPSDSRQRDERNEGASKMLSFLSIQQSPPDFASSSIECKDFHSCVPMLVFLNVSLLGRWVILSLVLFFYATQPLLVCFCAAASVAGS